MKIFRAWSYNFRKVTRFVQASFDWPIFTVSLLLLAIWLFSRIALRGSFGDEQENFVAAWLVTKGLVPYRDFFFHHAPLPYFLGAPLYWLGSQPWAGFRWLMVSWFALTGAMTSWLIHPKWRWAVGLGWVGLALLTPVLHLQMFLAESWLVPALMSLTLLTVSFWRFGLPKLSTMIWLWLLLSWVAIGSSIVTIPSVLWLAIGIALAMYQRGKKDEIVWSKFFWVAALLYGGWLGYFAWHHALADAQWAIFTYNLQYYFPLRLAGSAAQAQAGYGLTVLTNFWQYLIEMMRNFITANVTLSHTLLGIVKTGKSAHLSSFLMVAFTEWSRLILTLPMLSWLLLILVISWNLWRKQGWFAMWWLVLLVTFRGRENENFKLGPYYAMVVLMAAITWLETWRQKQWWGSFLVGLVLVGWVSVLWPTYQTLQQQPVAIIPLATVTVGERLKQNLAAHSSTDSNQRIFILGGNPVYYLLASRLPANKYFYYHPWFHGAPPIRQAVMSFLKTNTTAPVVLESEIDGDSLNYAVDLEKLVRARAATHSAGIYWF